MRNPDAKLIDFSELVGIIPNNPKFLPSDLDMVCERNGHFLVFEFKRGAEQISKGQEILLKQLAKTPKFTVVKVDGYSENGLLNIGNLYYLNANEAFLYAGNGKQRLIEFIQNWYKSVNYES